MKVRVFDSANQKRDQIVSSRRRESQIPEIVSEENVSSEERQPAGYAEALRRYEAYMDSHRKRRTPERLFVLRQIYAQKVPVDIQTLHAMVCKEEGQVSLTTIYNNLSMLIDAHLVRRLDLVGGAMAFFEKTLGVEPHGYMVCQRCGKIRTLQVEKLQDVIVPQLPKAFQISDINLQVNGLCKKCQTAIHKELEQERKAAELARQALNKSRKKKRKKK